MVSCPGRSNHWLGCVLFVPRGTMHQSEHWESCQRHGTRLLHLDVSTYSWENDWCVSSCFQSVLLAGRISQIMPLILWNLLLVHNRGSCPQSVGRIFCLPHPEEDCHRVVKVIGCPYHIWWDLANKGSVVVSRGQCDHTLWVVSWHTLS